MKGQIILQRSIYAGLVAIFVLSLSLIFKGNKMVVVNTRVQQNQEKLQEIAIRLKEYELKKKSAKAGRHIASLGLRKQNHKRKGKVKVM